MEAEWIQYHLFLKSPWYSLDNWHQLGRALKGSGLKRQDLASIKSASIGPQIKITFRLRRLVRGLRWIARCARNFSRFVKFFLIHLRPKNGNKIVIFFKAWIRPASIGSGINRTWYQLKLGINKSASIGRHPGIIRVSFLFKEYCLLKVLLFLSNSLLWHIYDSLKVMIIDCGSIMKKQKREVYLEPPSSRSRITQK